MNACAGGAELVGLYGKRCRFGSHPIHRIVGQRRLNLQVGIEQGRWRFLSGAGNHAHDAKQRQ